MAGFLIEHVTLPVNEKDLQQGWLATRGKTISAMGAGDAPVNLKAERDLTIIDGNGAFLLPGFIDLHVHGAMGHEVMDGSLDGLREMARFYASHGVTAWLPSTWTATQADTDRALDTVSKVIGPVEAGATILGAHLEGPYLSTTRCGAQNRDLIRPADRKEALRWLETGIVRLIAIAPEIEENQWLIGECLRRGITVSAGHTDATYDQIMTAVELGVSQTTHTFNAMRPFTHREPGTVCAALTIDRLSCELIADGFHVHPAAMNLLWKTRGTEGIILITDAVRPCGMPPGEYELEGQTISTREGVAKMKDGTLAGSILTMDRALTNFSQAVGAHFASQWKCASFNAARSLRILNHKGSLLKGKDADMVLLDGAGHVQKTIAEGSLVFQH